MDANNKRLEKLLFNLGKLKIEATNPGKETRFLIVAILVGLFVILLALIAAIYFLKINPASAGISSVAVGSVIALVRKLRGNTP